MASPDGDDDWAIDRMVNEGGPWRPYDDLDTTASGVVKEVPLFFNWEYYQNWE